MQNSGGKYGEIDLYLRSLYVGFSIVCCLIVIWFVSFAVCCVLTTCLMFFNIHFVCFLFFLVCFAFCFVYSVVLYCCVYCVS